MSVRLYSVSSGTSCRSAASIAIGSMPRSARIWAEAIGWVTYGSPVARRWPVVRLDREVEGAIDGVEVGRGWCSAIEALSAVRSGLEIRLAAARAADGRVGNGRAAGADVAAPAIAFAAWAARRRGRRCGLVATRVDRGRAWRRCAGLGVASALVVDAADALADVLGSCGAMGRKDSSGSGGQPGALAVGA